MKKQFKQRELIKFVNLASQDYEIIFKKDDPELIQATENSFNYHLMRTYLRVGGKKHLLNLAYLCDFLSSNKKEKEADFSGLFTCSCGISGCAGYFSETLRKTQSHFYIDVFIDREGQVRYKMKVLDFKRKVFEAITNLFRLNGNFNLFVQKDFNQPFDYYGTSFLMENEFEDFDFEYLHADEIYFWEEASKFCALFKEVDRDLLNFKTRLERKYHQ